ncbi:MFS transporter [Microbacterium sp. ZXX196]|nr:MFS transporter [Microbacterium sp. ZXX196]MTE22933.1 MFS transporter [Microbacterium sp. ZXX196]
MPGGDLAAVQRRTVLVLSVGQVLGGIATGVTVSLGALLAADVSGSEALSGLSTAGMTLGAAIVAVPLASLARRAGRRPSLATGMIVALVGILTVVAATAIGVFALLLAGFALIGAGQAANLQSRFAAADLATERTRGRDLSLVVWATTVGSVLGPNLTAPGEAIGRALGMPELTGPYVFSIAAQLAALALYLVFLRPDPLRLANRLAREASASARAPRPDRPVAARFAILAVAGSHAVMVAVMAMTPVHLAGHGAALHIIGLTISLHIAGMYALSPVFGLLADRVGRVATILLGQGILAASLVMAALGQDSAVAVTIALVLLGLGWSAATVAGASLLTEASAPEVRVARQGRSDLTMNLAGGLGAVAASGVLALIDYGGLAWACLAIVAVIAGASPLGRR